MDTAPTGHTLLLVDTAGAYHRQLTQTPAPGVAQIQTPLMRMQDPNYTKVLIVTLPETTPVLEATALQEDLRRAKIEPYAWVINGSVAAAGPSDPILRARAAAEVHSNQACPGRARQARSVDSLPIRRASRYRAVVESFKCRSLPA